MFGLHGNGIWLLIGGPGAGLFHDRRSGRAAIGDRADANDDAVAIGIEGEGRLIILASLRITSGRPWPLKGLGCAAGYSGPASKWRRRGP